MSDLEIICNYLGLTRVKCTTVRKKKKSACRYIPRIVIERIFDG